MCWWSIACSFQVGHDINLSFKIAHFNTFTFHENVCFVSGGLPLNLGVSWQRKGYPSDYSNIIFT